MWGCRLRLLALLLCTVVADFGTRQGLVTNLGGLLAKQVTMNTTVSASSSHPVALQHVDLPAPVIAMHQISPECQALGVRYSTVMRGREFGNVERWSRAIQKSLTGTARVAVLGGSVAAGHACYDNSNRPNLTCAWPSQFERMLSAEHLSVRVDNLAAGGTSSRGGGIQALMLGVYDAIIIHWTANDDNTNRWFGDMNGGKKDFETLVRTALSLPQQPAVIVFDGLGWLLHLNHEGGALETTRSEELHRSVARVYDLPFISAPAAFWHQQQNLQDIIEHFSKGNQTIKDNFEKTYPKGDIHPKRPWHQRYACLLFESWMFQRACSSEQFVGPPMKDMQAIAPVFGGKTLSCDSTSTGGSSFDGTLQAAATKIDGGWSYYADSGEKYGFISSTENSSLQFRFDLPANTAGRTSIFIHYLSSYTEEWGKARVSISCKCGAAQELCIPFEGDSSKVINSRTSGHASQLAEFAWQLKSKDNESKTSCTTTLTTITGKFKLLRILACNSNLLLNFGDQGYLSLSHGTGTGNEPCTHHCV